MFLHGGFKMRLYQVVIEESTLHFICVDKDHVITLLSQIFNTDDYFYLKSNAKITQISGPKGADDINFYLGV